MADDPIEEELRELEAELSEDAGDGTDDAGDAADAAGAAPGAGDEADRDAGGELDDLEAELGGGDATDSVGLDSDPSEQYADLLDDGPGGEASASAPERSEGDGDDGGFLSGLLGGSDDESEVASPGDGSAPRESGADAAADALADVGGLDEELGGATDSTAGDAAETAGASGDTTSTGTSGGLRARLGGYFSLRVFVAAVVLSTVLAGVGRVFVPLPLVGGAVGVWLATFLVGLASGDGRYLESAVAGAAVGALGAVAAGVSVAVASGATERLLAVGGVGGLVVAIVGHYFGRDLRAGLVGGDDWSEPEP